MYPELPHTRALFTGNRGDLNNIIQCNSSSNRSPYRTWEQHLRWELVGIIILDGIGLFFTKVNVIHCTRWRRSRREVVLRITCHWRWNMIYWLQWRSLIWSNLDFWTGRSCSCNNKKSLSLTLTHANTHTYPYSQVHAHTQSHIHIITQRLYPNILNHLKSIQAHNQILNTMTLHRSAYLLLSSPRIFLPFSCELACRG